MKTFSARTEDTSSSARKTGSAGLCRRGYPCGISSISFFSEVAVESDLMYMLQPSRMYIGDNINVFHHGNTTLTHVYVYACIYVYVYVFAGSLVTEHPGTSPSPIQGKPILYGSVHGAVGIATHTYVSIYLSNLV